MSPHGCVIKPPDQIVVLNIEPMNRHTFDISERLTDALRSEAIADGLNLSSHRRYAMYEQWEVPCTATPTDDGQCMAAVGRRLKADWVLWGTNTHETNKYTVQLQLISITDGQHREIELSFAAPDLSSAVKSAWRELVAP